MSRGQNQSRVCVCVCVCDVWTLNLVEGLTSKIPRICLKVKVKGQGRHVEKRDFGRFGGGSCVDCADPFRHDMRHHVMSRCDVITS